MRRIVSVIAFATSLFPCSSLLFAQEAGERVVVIAREVKLILGDQVVDTAYEGHVGIVHKVDGNWMKASFNGIQGWIPKESMQAVGAW